VKNNLCFLILTQIKLLKTLKRSINMPGHKMKKKNGMKKNGMKKGMTKKPKKMSMKKRRGSYGY